MKTGDAKLDELLAECDAYVASMREELRQIRPQLLALKELYQCYIDQIRLVLFVSSPRLPSGGCANLPPKVEQECEAAVVAVLKRNLAKVVKALGQRCPECNRIFVPVDDSTAVCSGCLSDFVSKQAEGGAKANYDHP